MRAAKLTETFLLAARRRSLSSKPNEEQKAGECVDPSLARWPRCPDASPYQILGHERDGPYNKKHFADLAMVYHPDSQKLGADAIPRAERLERFRKLVQAHRLLSDPQKRQLYDSTGLGWHMPKAASCETVTTDDSFYSQAYARAPPRSKEDVFVRRGIRWILVLLFALVGGFVQLKRAAKAARDLEHIRWRTHVATLADLMLVRTETSQLSREQRIQRFLCHRGLKHAQMT